MSELIYLTNVRLSFPHIIEPQRTVNAETGKERIAYSADFLLDKDDPQFGKFMNLVNRMAQIEWKEHAAAVMTMINSDRKVRCFGTEVDKINKKTFLPYDGYVGKVYITASRDRPPQMIDEAGQAVPLDNTMQYQQLARKMYGGCRVNVAVKPWAQKNKHGNGIRSDLVAIQFCKDDVAFGEGDVDASAGFGAVASAPVAMPSFLGG